MIAKTESLKELKAELLHAADLLATGASNTSLRRVQEKLRPEMKLFLVFNWIPEQGEDIYWLLGDKEEILIVDLPRQGSDESAASMEAIDLRTFSKKKLTAETRRRFEAALEIVKERGSAM